MYPGNRATNHLYRRFLCLPVASNKCSVVSKFSKFPLLASGAATPILIQEYDCLVLIVPTLFFPVTHFSINQSL